MSQLNHHYALIIAGGAGTRLWPISRQSRPKQFQSFVGEQTLLRHMYEAVNQLLPAEQIFVMATQEFGDTILEQIPELNRQNLLFEPARKDNGPAALYGMLQIHQRDPEAIAAILWSDHLIKQPENFSTMLEACFAASTEFPTALVTVGASASSPDTGLGYIQMGEEKSRYGELPVFTVKRFVEKPDLATATRFITSWKYLWNTGYKIMPTKEFIAAFERVQPDLVPTITALKKAKGAKEISEVYSQFPKQGIEMLFTPFLSEILVIPAEIGWSDIGNWHTLHEMLKDDSEDHMVTKGEVLNIDSDGCLVYAKDRLVAAVGLHDLIIVDDGDCLLVMDKHQAHKIKTVISTLENLNKELL